MIGAFRSVYCWCNFCGRIGCVFTTPVVLKVLRKQTPLISDLIKMIGVFTSKIIFHHSNLRRAHGKCRGSSHARHPSSTPEKERCVGSGKATILVRTYGFEPVHKQYLAIPFSWPLNKCRGRHENRTRVSFPI